MADGDHRRGSPRADGGRGRGSGAVGRAGRFDRTRWVERARSRAWVWYLAACALAIAAYLGVSLLPLPRSAAQIPQSVIYDCVGVSAVLAVWAGIRLHHPSNPVAWYLIMAGLAAFCLGDIGYDVMLLLAGSVPFPSPADALYLLGYPFIITGLLVLIHARAGIRHHATLVDGLIVTLGVALVAWEFLIRPTSDDQTLSLTARLVSMAHPLFDLVLLATAVRLTIGRPHEVPALALLLVGLYGQLVGDVGYAGLSLRDAYLPGGTIDVGFLAAYAFIGAAALHPSMRVLAEPITAMPMRLSRPRVALLAAAGLVPPLLLYAHARHPDQAVELPLLTAGMTLLSALVFIRIASLAETLADQATLNRHLLDETVTAVERERTKLANQLQEGPIQRLTGIGLTAELADRRLRRGRADQASDLLNRLGREIAAEIAGLRQVMAELIPPVLSEVGLGKAVRTYMEDFERRTGIHATGSFDAAIVLGRDERTILYRIAQEALTNVARHSGARNVRVTLRADGESARLTVVDDGSGFEPGDAGHPVRQTSLGLIGMRHRAEMVGGTFEIRSRPGEGTTVEATVPYLPED